MNPTLLPTMSFRRRADARHRNIGGEGVVVKQKAGEVLVVSEVGARVLDLVESGTDVRGMLQVLAAEYDVAPDALERDVTAYLRQLLDAEVIEPVAA
jgi:hypothetical protein